MHPLRVIVFFVLATAAIGRKAGKREYDLREAPALFEKYVRDYNKVYKGEADMVVHYEAFKHSLREVNRLNFENENTAYDLNQFSDYTEEELKTIHGVLLPKHHN